MFLFNLCSTADELNLGCCFIMFNVITVNTAMLIMFLHKRTMYLNVQFGL